MKYLPMVLLLSQIGCVPVMTALEPAEMRYRRAERARRAESQLVAEERRARRIGGEHRRAADRLKAKSKARRAKIDRELRAELAMEREMKSPLRRGSVVALLPIESHEQDAVTTDALDALLFLELTAADRFRFVPRRAIEAANRDLKASALTACADAQCAIEIGRALAAERVLVPRLFGSADGCVVALTLYDLRTETGDWAATAKAPCEDRALRDAATRLAKKLTVSKKPKARPMAAEHEPPAAPPRPPRPVFRPVAD